MKKGEKKEIESALKIADRVYEKEFVELRDKITTVFDGHNLLSIYLVLTALKEDTFLMMFRQRAEKIWDDALDKENKQRYFG